MSDVVLGDTLPHDESTFDKGYLGAGHTIRSWIFTTDHKRIAILYTLTLTVFFFIGGIAIALVRIELV